MSDCVERIRSEEDQRDWRVAAAAQQGGDEAKEYLEGLRRNVGKVYVVDEVELQLHAELDQSGLEDLKALSAMMG